MDVVNNIVPVEQVRHRCRSIGAWRLGQIQREIEIERRAPVGLRACVDRIVRVCIRVSGNVVADGQRRFGAGHAVGIVPAEWACRRIGWIGHDRARTVVRRLGGDRINVVLRDVIGPVVGENSLSAGGVDRNVIPVVVVIRWANDKVPRKPGAIGRRIILRRRGNRVERQLRGNKRRIAILNKHLRLMRPVQIQSRRRIMQRINR